MKGYIYTNKGYLPFLKYTKDYNTYSYGIYKIMFMDMLKDLDDREILNIHKLEYADIIDDKDYNLDNAKITPIDNREIFINRSYNYLINNGDFSKLQMNDKKIRLMVYLNDLQVPDKDEITLKLLNNLNDNFNKVEIMEYIFKSDIEATAFNKYFKKGLHPDLINFMITSYINVKDNKTLYTHHKIDEGHKIREIYAPNDEIKKASKTLLNLLDSYYKTDKVGDCQYAYTKDKNIKMNADIHKDYLYTYKTDIKGFFDACNWDLTKKYIINLFNNYKLDEEDIDILQAILINPATNGLYQGNPLSGKLSNLILRPAAIYLNNIFAKDDMVISIYADDITISSKDPISKNSTSKRIEYVFSYYNLPFKLHPDKTKLVKRNGRKITGVRINHKDVLTVPRANYRNLRTVLDYMERGIRKPSNIHKFMGNINHYLFIDETKKVERLLIKYKETLFEEGYKFKYNDEGGLKCITV